MPPGAPRRGELYWLALDPAGGAPTGIAHPHLVVQEDVFNRSRVPTIIVCALTTNLHRATEPGNVLLDPDEGGLTRQSVIVVSQISAVDRSSLTELIGTLDPHRVDQALAGLRFQQAAFFPRE